MKFYFAHPIRTYDNPKEAMIVAYLAKKDEVFDPSALGEKVAIDV